MEQNLQGQESPDPRVATVRITKLIARVQNDFQTAANRACDNQHNQCANLANSKKQFSVNQCDQQSSELNFHSFESTVASMPC